MHGALLRHDPRATASPVDHAHWVALKGRPTASGMAKSTPIASVCVSDDRAPPNGIVPFRQSQIGNPKSKNHFAPPYSEAHSAQPSGGR